MSQDIRKIIINTRHSGFDLSDEAMKLIKSLKTTFQALMMPDRPEWVPRFPWHLRRDDVFLVFAVEHLGKRAGHTFSVLKVVEIPADVQWEIDEYDGREWVSEIHRTWE